MVKDLPANARDTDLIPGLGGSHVFQVSLSATTTEARVP